MTKRAKRAGPPRPPNGANQAARQRVFAIAKLMAGGEWDTDATPPRLAREWRVAVGYVRKMATEASRLLEYTVDDRKTLKAFCQTRLRELAELNVSGAVSVQALRTLLESIGELRQRHIVSDDPDPFGEWSEAELEHYSKTGERPERLREGSVAGSEPGRPSGDTEESGGEAGTPDAPSAA